MWLNFEEENMKESSFISTILIITGFSIFIGFGLIFFQNCRLSSSWQRSFISTIPYEKQNWLKADVTGTITGKNLRPGMARYLTEQKVLIGKSREEIVEMLGDGEEREIYGRKTIIFGLEEIYRSIDPIAFEFLNVSFDKENKVEKAEIQFQKVGGSY